MLSEDDTDAEAHWGAVISRYGIIYAEDPATGKRVPAFHRLRLESILSDEDYKAAVEYAPDNKKPKDLPEGRRPHRGDSEGPPCHSAERETL